MIMTTVIHISTRRYNSCINNLAQKMWHFSKSVAVTCLAECWEHSEDQRNAPFTYLPSLISILKDEAFHVRKNSTSKLFPNWVRFQITLSVTHFLATISVCDIVETYEWIKRCGTYIYVMEYYSAMKRNILESVLVRWINLEPVIQSEVSQKENNKYCIITHIYVI